MATTTATLSLSTDMLSSPINISAASTLMKADYNIGLDLVESGRGSIAKADGSKTAEFGLATALGNDKATKLFLVNLATDPTYFIDVDIHDTNLGRLYAGDWLFIPWSQTDVAAEIVIESPVDGSVCDYEYAVLKEPETLVAHS